MSEQNSERSHDGRAENRASFKQALANTVKRRGRVLSLVGGLIVFLTFVVKDGVREHLKDFGDAIDRAQTTAALHGDNQRMMATIQNIYQRVRYPADQQEDRDLIASRDPYQVYLVVLRVRRQSMDSLDTIRPLVEILPRQINHANALAELDNRLKCFDQSMSTFEESLPHDVSNVGPTVPKEQIPTLSNLNREASRLSHSASQLAKDVMNDAEHTQKNTTWWYRLWTIASYFLYTLGWGITIVGAWSGVEVKGAAG